MGICYMGKPFFFFPLIFIYFGCQLKLRVNYPEYSRPSPQEKNRRREGTAAHRLRVNHSIYCIFVQPLTRVRGISAFDSGPVTPSSTFFHTFDIPGRYFITSEGTNQQLCTIDVMDNGKLSAISSILLRKLELYGITGVPINCNWFDPFTAKFSQKQILTKFPNFIL